MRAVPSFVTTDEKIILDIHNFYQLDSYKSCIH